MPISHPTIGYSDCHSLVTGAHSALSYRAFRDKCPATQLRAAVPRRGHALRGRRRQHPTQEPWPSRGENRTRRVEGHSRRAPASQRGTAKGFGILYKLFGAINGYGHAIAAGKNSSSVGEFRIHLYLCPCSRNNRHLPEGQQQRYLQRRALQNFLRLEKLLRFSHTRLLLRRHLREATSASIMMA